MQQNRLSKCRPDRCFRAPTTSPFPCPPPPRPRVQIHWFSIINSCVTVLLLTGFLATILLRVLKADFVKYSREEGEGRRLAGGILRFWPPGAGRRLAGSSLVCVAG